MWREKLKRRAKVMATEVDRNWTAHLVISSEHAGLKPLFKRLEAELYRALARIDDPKLVRAYLQSLIDASAAWSSDYMLGNGKK